MKENLQSITDPERKAYCTDAEIIRFLKARDFDVSKSEPLLRDTLEWRFDKYKPHLIDPTYVWPDSRLVRAMMQPVERLLVVSSEP
jgi:hypothetical protein